MNNTHKLTTISVSHENYESLKRLGGAGDSFNDVLTKVLKKVKSPLQTDDLRVETSHDHSAAVEDSARTTGNGSADG